MSSKNTFEIKPVKELIEKYICGVSVDPFANKSKIATITNDLNPEYNTEFCIPHGGNHNDTIITIEQKLK